MERLRVIRVIPELHFGGVEACFLLQAKHHSRDRFDLRVCTFHRAGDAARRIAAEGIAVDVLGVSPAIRNPRATLALTRYLRHQRPDIVHSAIAEANFHSSLAATVARVPVRVAEEVGMPQRSPLTRRAMGVCHGLQSAILGVSQATCDYLVEQEHAPRERVRLNYNAIADAYLSPPTPASPSGGRTLRVVSVGRLVWQKDFPTLVRAAALVRDAGISIEVSIVGEGPERAPITSLVRDLGLQAYVHLVGFRSNVLEALDDADCFVLPSVSEGFGIAAVEAMARARPVIASDTPGLREVVEPLGNQCLFPPGDHAALADRLLRLADADLRELLGRQGRALAEDRYSATAYAERLESLYIELLGKSRREVQAR